VDRKEDSESEVRRPPGSLWAAPFALLAAGAVRVMDNNYPTGADSSVMSILFNHHLSSDGSAPPLRLPRLLLAHAPAHGLTRRPRSDVLMVVFDEADQMLGEFVSECLKILRACTAAGRPPQVLLFSATFSDAVSAFAQKLVTSAANKLLLPAEKLSLDVIKQHLVVCPRPEDKEVVLREMILSAAEKLGQTIVFVRTRNAAHRLHSVLAAAGHACTSISGELAHDKRDAVISEFRQGVTKIMIATDVLARGFDHGNVTLVVNFDPPVEHGDLRKPAFETYMHRIGRSGRFGRKGAAFNLVSTPDEKRVMQAISEHFKCDIVPVRYDDADAFEGALKAAGLA